MRNWNRLPVPKEEKNLIPAWINILCSACDGNEWDVISRGSPPDLFKVHKPQHELSHFEAEVINWLGWHT